MVILDSVSKQGSYSVFIQAFKILKISSNEGKKW